MSPASLAKMGVLEALPAGLIASEVAEGLSDAEIARRHGVSTTAVWFYRQRHGLPNGRPPKLARVKRELIEQLVASGATDGEIASTYGVSRAAVCAYRFKHAIASPRAVRGWAAPSASFPQA